MQIIFTVILYLVLKIMAITLIYIRHIKPNCRPGYMIFYAPTNVFYQIVTRDRLEYIEFTVIN